MSRRYVDRWGIQAAGGGAGEPGLKRQLTGESPGRVLAHFTCKIGLAGRFRLSSGHGEKTAAGAGTEYFHRKCGARSGALGNQSRCTRDAILSVLWTDLAIAAQLACPAPARPSDPGHSRDRRIASRTLALSQRDVHQQDLRRKTARPCRPVRATYRAPRRDRSSVRVRGRGRVSERLLRRLAMPASRDTVLRASRNEGFATKALAPCGSWASMIGVGRRAIPTARSSSIWSAARRRPSAGPVCGEHAGLARETSRDRSRQPR